MEEMKRGSRLLVVTPFIAFSLVILLLLQCPNSTNAIPFEACTSEAVFPPAGQVAAITNLLYVDFQGSCPDGIADNFASVSAIAGSRGGAATRHTLSASNPLPADLTPYTQIWVLDFSNAADNYPADFTKIANWFASGPVSDIIADGRYAASAFRGSSCYPDLSGANNDNLINNYLTNLERSGGGLLLATDVFPEGMNELCDALGIERFSTAYAGSATISSDAEFSSGTFQSTTTALGNKLTLSETISTQFPFMWAPLSGRNTVAKVHTVTGAVLGEFKSCPDGRSGNPSRTTVDRDGRVWAGNRNEGEGGRGSVVAVGLKELGQCVDRNGNGVIDTSTGLGNVHGWTGNSGGGVDGALDECILFYVRTNGNNVRAVALDRNNNVWIGGWTNKIHDLIDGNTGEIIRSINFGAGAYGALVDPVGVVWSSGWCGICDGFVYMNPADGVPHRVNIGDRTYGMGIDPDGHVWMTNYRPTGSSAIMKISGTSYTQLAKYWHGNYATGVAIESNYDVWFANRVGGGFVTHMRNDGHVYADIAMGSSPSGVSIDNARKIWVTCVGSNNAFRIEPRTNTIEMEISLGSGSSPYNYGDMTGTVVITNTADPQGTWTRRYDAGEPASWNYLTWDSNIPTYGEITVEGRAGSSEGRLEAVPYSRLSPGALRGFTGRYFEIRITIALLDRDATNEQRANLFVNSVSVYNTHSAYEAAVIDESSPLLMSPSQSGVRQTPALAIGPVSSSWRVEGDAARLIAPWGVQASGSHFYAHAWHENDRSRPAISSTIPSMLDFRVTVASPGCNDRAAGGDTVTLDANVVTSGTPPYSYTWKVNGGTVGTGKTRSYVVTLGAGDYSVEVVATDASGAQSLARSVLKVRKSTDEVCATNDDCSSLYCVDGRCCAPGSCDVSSSSDEVFLRGSYIELGIHKAGSFGSEADPPAGFNGDAGAVNSWGTGLGFIADFNRNGFNAGSPTKYAGDYFLPGDPDEGWALSWKTSAAGLPSVVVNKGRAGRMDVLPQTTSASSRDGVASSVWVGSSGPLTIRKVTSIGTDDLYFTTAVTVTNTGTTPLYEVTYLRTVDPDQEQPWTGNYATANYVKYQPQRTGDPAVRARSGAPNTALVVAQGITHPELYLGLGSVHANARVTHGGRDVDSPSAADADTSWATYSQANKRSADEAISLTFKFDQLDAGASAEFSFVYVLSLDEFDKASDSITALSIFSPLGTVSGTTATFSVRTAKLASSVHFELSSSSSTTDVGTSSEPSFLFTDGGGLYSLTYDTTTITTGFGVFVLRATATFPDGTSHSVERVIEVDNRGPVMSFPLSPTDGTYAFLDFEPNPVSVTHVGGPTPDQVTFYLETPGSSRSIGVDTSAPFEAAVDVGSYAVNTPVTIRAVAKSGTLESSTTFSGRVRERNAAPIDIAMTKTSVNENSPADTIVGQLSTTDANAGDRHTYTARLEDAALGTLPFAVADDLLVVMEGRTLDHEDVASYSVIVTSTDDAGASFSKKFIVTVTDLPEAPTDITISSASVQENVLLGTVVGSLSAVDQDAGDTHSWIVSDPRGKFRVEGNVLKVAGALDFEDQAVHTVSVIATDSSSLSYSRNIDISVQDVNEEPTDITVAGVVGNILLYTDDGVQYRIKENQPPNTVVGLVRSTDDDNKDGVPQVHTFTLLSNPESAFTLIVEEGVTKLVATKTFDFELRETYELTVSVVDDGTPPRSLTQKVIVAVEDVPEPPSVNDETFLVEENSRPNTFVGVVRATTQNADLALDFVIAEGNVDDTFRIDSCSGVLFVDKDNLDYEALTSYTLTVEVRGEINVNSTVVVNVADVNEAPSISGRSVTVDENLSSGTVVVADIAHSDPDAGDTVSFEIRSGNTLDAFQIHPATGEISVLNEVLDFESNPRYLLRVAVVDRGSPPRDAEADVFISLVDLNEPPTIASGGRTVQENVRAGTVLGAPITPFDPDVGQAHVLTFANPDEFLSNAPASSGNAPVLTSGTSATVVLSSEVDYQALQVHSQITAGGEERFVVAKNGGSPRTVTVNSPVDWSAGPAFTFRHTVFQIVQETKQVIVNAPELDFETRGTYALALVVTDSGASPLTGTATLTVTILDVNEAPIVDPTVTRSVSEDAPVGTKLASIAAADLDAGSTLRYTLSFLSEGAESAFSLNASTGVFSVSGALDFEFIPQYTFGVVVSDQFGLETPTEVIIDVDDVNEPPFFREPRMDRSVEELPTALVGSTAAVKTQTGELVDGTLDVHDPEGLPLTYEIVSGSPLACESAYEVVRKDAVEPGAADPYNAVVRIKSITAEPSVLDREALGASPFCTLVLRVTDNLGQTGTGTVTVHVEDVNEAPVMSAQSFTIGERSTASIAVDAVDPDSPTVPSFSSLSYAITGGNTRGRFAIDPTSGVLTPTNPDLLAFDAILASNNVDNIDVTATDPQGLSATATVTITVVNTNFEPSFEAFNVTVAENSPEGSLLGSVLVSDDDLEDQFTFSISGGPPVDAEGNPVFVFELSPSNSRVFLFKLGPGAAVGAGLPSDAALNFERKSWYRFTVEVRDDGSPAITNSAPVWVHVTDAPERPYFPPAILAARFEVEEGAPDGSAIRGAPTAMDVDAGAVLEYSLTDDAGGRFSIDSATGTILVADGASIDFEAAASHDVTVLVTDNDDLTRSATFTVHVINRNENPVVAPSQEFEVWEDAAGGDPVLAVGADAVAVVIASDPDRLPSCDCATTPSCEGCRLSYSITGGNTGGVFSIDPDTGVVRVAPGVQANNAGLDYEGIVVYDLRVTVSDVGVSGDIAPLSGSAIVRVHIRNVNDVAITGFSGDVPHPTSGGGVVLVSGRDFKRSVDLPGGGAHPATVVSFGGPDGTRYQLFPATGAEGAGSCVITSPTLLTCTTPAGSGVGHVWRVSVGDDVFVGGTTSFLPPKICDIVGAARLPSAGGVDVVIRGRDFGPVGVPLRVTYGPFDAPSRYAPDCAVTTAHSEITCTATAGVGQGLLWTLEVSSNTGPAFGSPEVVPPSSIIGNGTDSTVFNTTGSEIDFLTRRRRLAVDNCEVWDEDYTVFMSYEEPVVEAVSIVGGSSPLLRTSGGQVVTIVGRNFGTRASQSRNMLSVSHRQAPFRPTAPVYTVVDCAVVEDHVRIECLTLPGIGANHMWSVSVGRQSSYYPGMPSSSGSVPVRGDPVQQPNRPVALTDVQIALISTTYMKPQPALLRPAAEALDTSGGQVVEIAGAQFGPAGLVNVNNRLRVTYGPTGTEYVAASCAVTVNHVRIKCETVVGTGADHSWIVRIDGQSSDPVCCTRYAWPTIADYNGPGSSRADTRGDQSVTIVGRQFGPLGSDRIESVTYGPETGREFAALDCSVTVAHEQITCTTAPGAGKDHQWVVVLDGQESRAPLTSYGEPIVEWFAGPGAVAASANGGEVVDIYGLNFAAPPPADGITGPVYLEKVTYGPSGEEYDATAGCEVVDHTHLRCLTVAGVGPELRWIVRVAGQSSQPSTNTTGYALPSFASMTVGSDPSDITHGPTNGRVNGLASGNPIVVRVKGDDFGVNDPQSEVFVEFRHVSYVTEVAPREKEGGQPPVWQEGGVDMFDFELPEGYGVELEVVIGVRFLPSGTVEYSAAKPFAYDPPQVLVPVTQESPPGSAYFLEMELLGVNFGNNGDAISVHLEHQTGDVFGDPHPESVDIGGGRVSTPCDEFEYVDHTAVKCKTNVLTGDIKLTLTSPTRSGPESVQVSPPVFFELFSPLIGALSCQPGAVGCTDDGGLVVPSSGGARLVIEGDHFAGAEISVFIAGNECVDVVRNLTDPAHQTVSCTIPPGQGQGHVPIIRRGAQESVGGPSVSYLTPAIDSIQIWQWQYPDGSAAPAPTPAPVAPGTRRLASGTPALRLITTHTIPISVSNPMELPTVGGVLRFTGSSLGSEPVVSIGWRGTQLRLMELPRRAGFNHTYVEVDIPSAYGTGFGLDLSSCPGDPAGEKLGYLLFLADRLLTVDCGTTDWLNRDTIPIRFAAPRVLEATRHGPTEGATLVLRGSGLGCELGNCPGAPFRTFAPEILIGQPGVDATQCLAGTGGAACAGLDPSRCISGSNRFMCAIHDRCVATAQECQQRCELVSWNDTTAVCSVPEGQGQNHPVSVSIDFQSTSTLYSTPKGSTASLSDAGVPLLWSYDAPVVEVVTPSEGPTSGMVPVSLSGRNFGPNPCVHLRRVLGSAVVDDVGPLCGDDLVDATHTSIDLVLPAGIGRRQWAVSTHYSGSTRGQTTTDVTSGAFRYTVPALSVMSPSSGPTDGGASITLTGANLGARSLRHPLGGVGEFMVSFGTKRCTLYQDEADAGEAAGTASEAELQCVVESHDHDSITINAPPGIGPSIPISVTVGEQAASSPLSYAYDLPTISFTVPNPADANGGILKVAGDNFGSKQDNDNAGVHPRVYVGSLPCGTSDNVNSTGVEWTNDEALTCRLPQLLVGDQNITVYVALQQSPLVPAAEGRVRVECEPGWHALLGEFCRSCPQGGRCDGGVGEPIAEPGWWAIVQTDVVAPSGIRVGECAGNGLAVPQRLNCTQIVRCDPPESCLGENNCRTGYTSEPPYYRCATCAEGYYKRGIECAKCPNNPWILIVVFVAAAVSLCLVGFVLNRKNVHLAFLSIGVDYFQVLALFATARVRWPSMIEDIWNIMSAFNFNIDITAPECSIPNVSFKTKWLVTQGLPIGAAILFGLVYITLLLHKYLIKGRRERLNSHAPAIMSAYLMVCYFLYLYITRTVLDLFNCAPTSPPDADGTTYLQVVFEPCWESGGLHMQLFPIALIAFFLYVLGYPSFVAFVVLRNRHSIMEDQLLRAYGQGDQRVSNPNCYEFRKRYHKLYYHFRPDKFYWILLILGRKFLIAVVALLFNRNVAFQLAMVLLVLFISYALQVRHSPYMSPSDHYDILRQHHRLAMEGGIHAKLQSTIVGIKMRGQRQARKVVRVGSSRTFGRVTSGLSFFWNYNTVESVLLFCAVLVSLGGIMFESGQFDDEYYSTHRDSVTICLMFVIFFSIAYFVVVLASEIYVTICASPKKPVKKKAGTLTEAQLAARRRRPSALWRDLEGGGGPGGDAPDAAINPMFQQTAAAMSTMDISSALDIPKAPDESTWSVLRLRLKTLTNDFEELQAQVARLKQDLQRGQPIAGTAAPVRRTGLGNKKRFLPKRAGANPQHGRGAAVMTSNPLTAATAAGVGGQFAQRSAAPAHPASVPGEAQH